MSCDHGRVTAKTNGRYTVTDFSHRVHSVSVLTDLAKYTLILQMKVLISTDGKISKWLMLISKVFIKRDQGELQGVLFHRKIMVKTCGIISWCGCIDWFFESVSVTVS